MLWNSTVCPRRCGCCCPRACLSRLTSAGFCAADALVLYNEVLEHNVDPRYAAVLEQKRVSAESAAQLLFAHSFAHGAEVKKLLDGPNQRNKRTHSQSLERKQSRPRLGGAHPEAHNVASPSKQPGVQPKPQVKEPPAAQPAEKQPVVQAADPCEAKPVAQPLGRVVESAEVAHPLVQVVEPPEAKPEAQPGALPVDAPRVTHSSVMLPPDGDAAAGGSSVGSYLNTRIAKMFNEGLFFGSITSFRLDDDDKKTTKIWAVKYDDGDSEEVYEDDLPPLLDLYRREAHRDSQLRSSSY